MLAFLHRERTNVGPGVHVSAASLPLLLVLLCHSTALHARTHARPLVHPRPLAAPTRGAMSLHGLDSDAVTAAYQSALAEAGGWCVALECLASAMHIHLDPPPRRSC